MVDYLHEHQRRHRYALERDLETRELADKLHITVELEEILSSD